jgi:hypothetical protein
MKTRKIITMRKIIIMMLIIILSASLPLSLSGCSAGSSEKYHIGTEGVVVEFDKNNPISALENEEFGTVISVKNNGAHSIVDSYNPIVLRVDYDDYRLEPVKNNALQQSILLHGRDIYYPVGDNNFYQYYFKAKLLTAGRQAAITTIKYSLCYPYQTEFTTFACIDMKNSQDTAVSCTAQEYDGNGGQGAPIMVSKIVPESSFQEGYLSPKFRIYIVNAGKGYPTASNTCAGISSSKLGESSTSISNKVSVSATLSGTPMICGWENEDGTVTNVVKLTDSESYIKCKLDSSQVQKYARSNKNFITPLTVIISYTYIEEYAQEFTIQHNDDLPQEVIRGSCNSYEVESVSKTTGKTACISKCDYCSGDPNDAMCKPQNYNNPINFNKDFSCNCNAATCTDQDAKLGNCVKAPGFCPGTDTYCCANKVTCAAYEIEYNGKCISKCDYCSGNPESEICKKSISGTQFNEYFSCSCSLEQCNSMISDTSVGTCVKGYCSGNDYCCTKP